MVKCPLRAEPSKEMRAAMKVLNDAMLKTPSGNPPSHMKNAINIIQQEWFKVKYFFLTKTIILYFIFYLGTEDRTFQDLERSMIIK